MRLGHEVIQSHKIWLCIILLYNKIKRVAISHYSSIIFIIIHEQIKDSPFDKSFCYFTIIQKGCDNMPGMKGIYGFNPALVGAIIGLIIDLILCAVLP